MAQQPSRSQYSKQFKIDAVELSLKSNKTTREIADDLGISPNVLYRWRGQYQASNEQAFPGTGNLRDAQCTKSLKAEHRNTDGQVIQRFFLYENPAP